MLVLTPKYGSQINLDLLKKQKDKTKEPLIKHRNDIIYLTHCKDIEEAYLTFLDNKGKYIIGYKPKDAKIINEFVKSLEEIDILDVSWIDVSELSDLRYCFSYCKAKHIIGLDKWDVSNVKDMSLMFADCKTLKIIDISGWDVSNVTSMTHMFSYSKCLESIDISGWNISKVRSIGGMFYCCKNLESIGDISGWDVSNVKNMRSMFSGGCKKLKYVGDLEQWNISDNVDKHYMFENSAIKPIPSWYTNKI